MSEKIIVSVGEAKFELLPGFDQLRKCSFRPQDHLILVRFEGREEPALYLEVKWRLIWLQTYCEELNLSYAVIEEEPKQIGNDITSVCKVLINDKLVGQGTGGMRADSLYAIQQAATIAKGRALANAGFGGVFAGASASENGGLGEIPCDSGMRTSEIFRPIDLNTLTQNEVFPFKMDAAQEKQSPVKKATERKSRRNTAHTETSAPAVNQPEPQPQPQPVQPAPQAQPTSQAQTKYEFTEETARDFVVLVQGKWKNKTIGEVYAENPSSIQYFADKGRYPDLKSAAQAYLNFKNAQNAPW